MRGRQIFAWVLAAAGLVWGPLGGAEADSSRNLQESQRETLRPMTHPGWGIDPVFWAQDFIERNYGTGWRASVARKKFQKIQPRLMALLARNAQGNISCRMLPDERTKRHSLWISFKGPDDRDIAVVVSAGSTTVRTRVTIGKETFTRWNFNDVEKLFQGKFPEQNPRLPSKKA